MPAARVIVHVPSGVGTHDAADPGQYAWNSHSPIETRRSFRRGMNGRCFTGTNSVDWPFFLHDGKPRKQTPDLVTLAGMYSRDLNSKRVPTAP